MRCVKKRNGQPSGKPLAQTKLGAASRRHLLMLIYICYGDPLYTNLYLLNSRIYCPLAGMDMD